MALLYSDATKIYTKCSNLYPHESNFVAKLRLLVKINDEWNKNKNLYDLVKSVFNGKIGGIQILKVFRSYINNLHDSERYLLSNLENRTINNYKYDYNARTLFGQETLYSRVKIIPNYDKQKLNSIVNNLLKYEDRMMECLDSWECELIDKHYSIQYNLIVKSHMIYSLRQKIPSEITNIILLYV